MAAKGQSYAEKFSRWEVLITNAKPHVTDMPHITEDLATLEQKLTEVRALESRQEDLRSQSREMSKQVRVAAQEGEKIRGRLGSTLKGKYGPENETLLKYGFKPRQQAVRKKKPAPATSPEQGSAKQG